PGRSTWAVSLALRSATLCGPLVSTARLGLGTSASWFSHTGLRLSSSRMTRASFSRDWRLLSVRFHTTTRSTEPDLPRSTSHHGSFDSAVWVVESAENSPLVL